MWDDYAQNAEQPADWHRRYMEFMFDVEDTSGEATPPSNRREQRRARRNGRSMMSG